jgi:hypothetical protein
MNKAMNQAINAPLTALDGSTRPSAGNSDAGIAAAMRQIGREAKGAARTLALAPVAQKNRALAAMANAIRAAATRPGLPAQPRPFSTA